MFSGFHNTGLFAVPPLQRYSVYFSVIEWCSSLYPTNIVQIQTAPVFRYYSERVLRGNSLQEDEIWHISESEFFDLVFMCFLSTAHDGVNASKTGDFLISSERYGIFCPLPAYFVSSVESLGLFHVVRVSRFDAEKSLVAFKKSS